MSFYSFFYKLAKPYVSKIKQKGTDKKHIVILLAILHWVRPHPNSLCARLGWFVHAETIVLDIQEFVEQKAFAGSVLPHKRHKPHRSFVILGNDIQRLVIELDLTIGQNREQLNGLGRRAFVIFFPRGIGVTVVRLTDVSRGLLEPFLKVSMLASWIDEKLLLAVCIWRWLMIDR